MLPFPRPAKRGEGGERSEPGEGLVLHAMAPHPLRGLRPLSTLSP